GNLVFFGTTMMLRLPYPHKISDFIPTNLKGSELDLAETIFGRVRQNVSDTHAGRVFFTDAIWTNKNEIPFLKNDGDENGDGRRVPKILASPKPTSFQLYLNQPTVDTTPKRRQGRLETIQDGDLLKSYYNKGETLIRGTKLYWSKTLLSTAQDDFVDLDAKIEGDEESGYRVDLFKEDRQGRQRHRNRNGEWSKDSSQHTIIRPVKSGIEFESRVYFENLTKLELGALLTALELPASKRHRLGMGKPLGLGTIEIRTEVLLQNRNPQEDSSAKSRYELLFDGEGKWYTAERNDSRTI